MASDSEASAGDPHLALAVLREQNNVQAAARGLIFCLLLAFNRLMDRASRPRLHGRAEVRPSHTRDWLKRALLGIGSAGTAWMTLSPRAHAYLSMAAQLIFHLRQSGICP